MARKLVVERFNAEIIECQRVTLCNRVIYKSLEADHSIFL
jgi:hypothetical protein